MEGRTWQNIKTPLEEDLFTAVLVRDSRGVKELIQFCDGTFRDLMNRTWR